MGCIGSWFLIDVIVLHIKKKIIKKCFLKNYYYYFYGPLRVEGLKVSKLEATWGHGDVSGACQGPVGLDTAHEPLPKK